MAPNYNISESALWVMTLAEMAAAREGRDAATPIDVLLGLMLISDPAFSEGRPSLAGHLIRAACIAPDDLPTLADLGWNDLPDRPRFAGNFTPAVTDLMEGAMLHAQNFGTPYVGAEHLLVSLLGGNFGSDVEAWMRDADLTEAEVLRQWVAILLRAERGDPGLGLGPMAEA